MSGNKYDAFVSYADDGEKWAIVFIDNLESLGVRAWHRGRIQPGEKRDRAARTALEQSGTLLLILSPGAACAADVQRDLNRWNFTRPVIPIDISGYEYPDKRIVEITPVPLSSYENEGNAERYQKEVVRLARTVSGKEVEEPSPPWAMGDVPPSLGVPVGATVWRCAVHIVASLYGFANILRSMNEYTRLSGRFEWLMAAHRHIYSSNGHRDAERLAAVVNGFRAIFDTAAKSAAFSNASSEWWREAYAQVDDAADIARIQQEAAKEKAQQEKDNEQEAEEQRKIKHEQEEADQIAAKRAKEQQSTKPDEKCDSGRAVNASISKTHSSRPAQKGSSVKTTSHIIDEPRVDFVIITALEEERKAVLSKLKYRKLDRDGSDTHTYYDARVATNRQDRLVYRIIVTSLSGMGPIKGAIKASAIRRWNPTHVLMVGIAGGVEGEVNLGDVMVASQIADYTLGKIPEKGSRQERWMPYPADSSLFDAAENFPSGWEDLITQTRPSPGAPKRRTGVIASGGDVVASKEQIAIFRDDWPKLIGVEMEGGGVAAGLHDDMARPRFLMIRGVSDLANGENNAQVKLLWRAYACDVAAAYAIGLLRDGPVQGTHAAFPVEPPAAAAAPTLLRGSPRASAIPTWGELAAASHAYEVNSLDDAVLCMHPDAERDWLDVVPNARTATLTCVTIQTPKGSWHRDGLDVATWRSVFTNVKDGLQRIRDTNPKRIHLLAKAPFSLGALLGARLDPQNHKLLVYQPDNKEGSKEQKIWRPWGPEWPADPGTRSSLFFDLPPELGQFRIEEDGDIAIIIDITGRSEPESCVKAIRMQKSHRPVRSVLVKAQKTSQKAIGVPADVDKAANELSDLLQQIPEMLPNATLHLFYYGPLAVLIRASRGLCLRRVPILVYEAIYPDGNLRWLPAIRFPQGTLLVEEHSVAAID